MSEVKQTPTDEPEPLTKKRRSIIPGFTFPPHREERKAYNPVNNRPRWVLHMQATIWRFLMSLGMFFHRLAPPRPPKPNFSRTINTTISGESGQVILYFYVPQDYEAQKRLWNNEGFDAADDEEEETPIRRNKTRMSISSIGDGLRRRSRSMRRWGGYPCVVNFHGGGFTLGSPFDDARWCGTVVEECNAVVVSVDYRLAPEHPFPTAVEDGVDAVLWLHKHAEELGINTDKIALSGFSSGGNMSFTVPLRLYDQQTGFARSQSDLHLPLAAHDSAADVHPLGRVTERDEPGSSSSDLTASTSATAVPNQGADSNVAWIDPDGPPPVPSPQPHSKDQTRYMERSINLPEVRIKCIISWYPSLDYTRTREERRATCVRADQELPALFTNLFDDSYLHPPKDVSLDSPYLSPGVAPTSLLRDALPEEIILHTCEWDMLLDEGQDFHRRLTSEPIGKKVAYTMVPEVPHGWDKAPNPWKPTPGVREYYLKACKELKRVFGEKIVNDEAMPRKSIVR